MAKIDLYLAGLCNDHVLGRKATSLETLVHLSSIRISNLEKKIKELHRPRRLSIFDIENITDNYQSNLEYQWELQDLTDSLKEAKQTCRQLIAIAISCVKHNAESRKVDVFCYSCWNCEGEYTYKEMTAKEFFDFLLSENSKRLDRSQEFCSFEFCVKSKNVHINCIF